MMPILKYTTIDIAFFIQYFIEDRVRMFKINEKKKEKT